MEIRDSDFEEMVLQSDRPVLVCFWASWNQSCRLMQSVVERLELVVDDWADVYFVKIDRSPGLASQYEVDGVPTFVVFAKGHVVDRKVGPVTDEQLLLLLKLAENSMNGTPLSDDGEADGTLERAA